VGKDPFHFKNELLPDTRAEAALPLRLGDRVIGALDVQSRQSEAFKPSDLEVLQILTDQLAVAIENGRLFGRQQRLAQIEQLLFEFAGKIHQSPNFDTILENAALELGRVFGASKAVVRLKREGQPAPPAPGNGQHL
jgi:GAF domain-containing protein